MHRILLLGSLALAACTPPGGMPSADFAAQESSSYKVKPTNEIRTSDYEGATPTEVMGARVISTAGLQALIKSSSPVLIDVLDGVSTSIPDAILLAGSGQGTSLDDSVQKRLKAKLLAITNREQARPLVFFCLSQTCWLSHNAVVRAVAAGYTNVYWYRGGRNAWLEAGLPMQPVRPTSW